MDIDVSEFEGNASSLSKILEKNLQRKISVHRHMLQIDDKLSKSKVRSALKHALHKLEPESYHIISKSSSLIIKKVKSRSPKIERTKGTPPSASQTLPYFFPH